MKIAIQQTILPGSDLKEKFQRAADYGFDAIELAAWGFDKPIFDYLEEIEAAKSSSGLPVSSMCPSSADDLVHPEPAKREKRLSILIKKMQFADEIGATGTICLPIRPPLHLPDLSPVASEHDLITQLTVAMLQSAIEQTPQLHINILLEPLNRYEAYYLQTVGHAAALCQAADSPRVKVMADLYHMNIEEASIAGALHDVMDYVGHVHLADSNRLEPGKGHTDFVEAFRILREDDFEGWFAYECRLSGDPDQALPDSVRFVRECWDRTQN